MQRPLSVEDEIVIRAPETREDARRPMLRVAPALVAEQMQRRAARRVAWATEQANKRANQNVEGEPTQSRRKRRRGVAQSLAVVEGVRACLGGSA